jgi:hypothetical protein
MQSYGLHTAQLLDCMAQIQPPRPMARGETRNYPSDSHNTCHWMQLAQQRLTLALRVQIKRIAALGVVCVLSGCAVSPFSVPDTPLHPIDWKDLDKNAPHSPSYMWDALRNSQHTAA